MIQALVFDFDGLIVDTETPLVDAWEAVHARRGIACDRTVLFGVVGHVGIDFDPWAAFGPSADREALEAEYRRHARSLTWSQPLLPGVEPLLQEARARGLRLGVASNSPRSHVEGHLGRLGLLGRFDAIRCIEDVTAGKPAPDLYLASVAALGAEPGRTIAFEDSLPGHLAAKRAGLRCVVVPNPSTAHHEFPHADWRLASLVEATVEALSARFAAPLG